MQEIETRRVVVGINFGHAEWPISVLIKANMEYLINEALAKVRAWEKRQIALSQIHNINEAEEAREKEGRTRRVFPVWRQRRRTRETCHVLSQSLKARPSYFPVKLVIITNEFAIIIEVTRLSCDGLVIIAQPDCTFGPRLNLVRALYAPSLSSLF